MVDVGFVVGDEDDVVVVLDTFSPPVMVKFEDLMLNVG